MLPGNKDRLADEVKRVSHTDKLRDEALAAQTLSPEDRWRVELRDSFEAIANTYAPPARGKADAAGDGARPELGRLGFKQLIQDGKLLSLPRGTADACYDSVDSDASGCVSFEEVWVWFLFEGRAQVRRSKNSASIRPQLSKIVPAKDRALLSLVSRFQDKSAYDLNDYKKGGSASGSKSNLMVASKEEDDDYDNM